MMTSPVRQLAVFLLFCFSGLSASAATFTVTSGADSGPGTLRQAILDANATPGRDQIVLAAHVSLTTPTPTIIEPVDITSAGANISYRIATSSTSTAFVLLHFATTADGSTVHRVEFDTRGTAIRMDASSMTVTRVVVDDGVIDIAGDDNVIGDAVAANQNDLHDVNVTGDRTRIAGSAISKLTATGAHDLNIGLPGAVTSVLEAIIDQSDRLLVQNSYINLTLSNSADPVITSSRLGGFSSTGAIFTNVTNGRFTGNTVGQPPDEFPPPRGVVVINSNVEITGNTIFANGKSIDLDNDGTTPNDGPGDLDIGGNARQNYPVLTYVRSIPEGTEVTGTLTSAPLTPYLIEVYSSQYYLGGDDMQFFLGSFTVTTDASGQASFTELFEDVRPLHLTQLITATATNRGSTATPGNIPNTTSETSVAVNFDSPGALIFDPVRPTFDESVGQATITVRRTQGSANTITVKYSTTNGTATSPSDYTAVAGTLTFAQGVTTQSFNVPIVNDSVAEGNESFTVLLTEPTGGAVLHNEFTPVFIEDDDDAARTIGFQSASFTAHEETGQATVTVTRTGSTAATDTVSYATSNGSASAGNDYTATTGTITFEPGVATRTINVPVHDDTSLEPNETFTVTLSNPVGGATLGTATTTVTIVSNDTSGQFGFMNTAPVVDENAGIVTIAVTRSNSTEGTVTIDYATSNGTATAPGDYATTTGTLTFGPGITSRNIVVPIANDGTPESNETFTVTLSNPQGGGATLGNSTATVTIQDDDTAGTIGTIGFQSATQSVNESAGTTSITVTRTGTTTGTMSVDYATSNGTANAPADYTASSGTLTFDPGVTSRTIVVPIVNDALDEANETFTVTLSNPTGGATLGTSATTVTINDDDVAGTIGFQSTTHLIGEGAGTVTLTVSRSGGSAGTATVNYSTANGSATAPADYTTTSGTLTFGPGETSRTIVVPIVNDAADENNESFTVTLSNPTGGATLGSATATVTIIDDDGAGTIEFQSAMHAVLEGAGSVTITVSRTGSSDGTASVNYATSNGSATAPNDYTSTSGTLTFAPGETSRTIVVPIANDATPENDETFNLTLSNATGATVGTSTATVTITDDDGAGTIEFQTAAQSVDENDDTVTITVSRTGGSTGTVTVSYTTANGTATAPEDYTATSGTLTFGPGVDTQTIVIPIVDDNVREGDETFSVLLGSPTGGANLGSSTIVITIDERGTRKRRSVRH